jgi:hypothetical protein
MATYDATNPPERLYKYCGIHRADWPSPAETLLTQGRMFFPSAVDFNDPFDCQFQMTFDAPLSERQDFAREVVRERAPHDMPIGQQEELVRQGAKLESYARAAGRFINRIRTTVGMLCFSTKRDNILMWSHYAEMHRGICLEFRREEDLGNTLPVNYSDEFPILDPFEINADLQRDDNVAKAAAKKFIDAIYLTKAAQWKYEDEWRLVDPRKGRGLNDLSPGLLSGIILGCQTTDDDRERVRGWLRQASIGVQLFQAQRNPSAFRLDISPL